MLIQLVHDTFTVNVYPGRSDSAMPYYRYLDPALKGPGMLGHGTSAPLTTTSQNASHGSRSQVDGPADYRPQKVPFTTRNDYGQSIGQVHQQQQQRYIYQQQRLQMQSRPVHQLQNTAAPHVLSKQPKPAAVSVVNTLLPYCTAERPLNESQVIATTDVAGSLKELVLLALGAKDGEKECVSRLEGALGSEQAVAGVVDFFSDEFELE